MLPREKQEIPSEIGGSSKAEPRIAAEHEIETLVGRISSPVRTAEPQARDNLKDFAETLLRQEISDIGAEKASRAETSARPRMNPLAAGLLLLAAAAGLIFIVPPVGLTLIVLALALIIWGAVISWARK
jgi:hypothetical protein